MIDDAARPPRTLPGDLAEAALALAVVLGGLAHLGVAAGALALAAAVASWAGPGGGWIAAALGVLPVHLAVLGLARRLARRRAWTGRLLFAVGWVIPGAVLAGAFTGWAEQHLAPFVIVCL